MHRTQLYLDESRYSYVVSLAKKQKTSIAQIIRNFIDRCRQQEVPANIEDDPIFKIIGLAGNKGSRGMPVAENYETYLYGTEEQVRALEAEYQKKHPKNKTP